MTPAEAWVADTARPVRKTRQQKKVDAIRAFMETFEPEDAAKMIHRWCPRASLTQARALVYYAKNTTEVAQSCRTEGLAEQADSLESALDGSIRQFVSAHRRRLWGKR